MQRLVVLVAGGVGRCMLVLALTGVVDLMSRTGGSFTHAHLLHRGSSFVLHLNALYDEESEEMTVFLHPWAMAFPLTPASFSLDGLFRVSFLMDRCQLDTD